MKSLWEITKEALMEGDDVIHNLDGSQNTSKIKILDIVLDNTKRYIDELSAKNPKIEGTLNKILFPLVRGVMPKLSANYLIGVQALDSSEGMIHTVRVGYQEPTEFDKNIPPSDVHSSDKPFDEDVFTATAGNKLCIRILKELIKAQDYKFSCKWNASGLSNISKELEAEIMSAICQEILFEIDQKHLASLRNLTDDPTCMFDSTKTDGFVGDVHDGLAVLINRQANLIAVRTRRGAGNWCVVGPTALTILQSATSNAFTKEETDRNKGLDVKFFGKLSGNINVYVDQFANDKMPVLVGYKGLHEADAGAFYVPHLPIMCEIEKVKKKGSMITFQGRDGFHELSNTELTLGNGSDYYSQIGINTDKMTFV